MGFDSLVSCVHDTIKDTFGESVFYEALSGASSSIVGVFNDRYTTVDPDTQQPISSNQPTLGVKLADLVALGIEKPKKGDRVTLRERTYRIRDSREDGEGWLHLFLHEGVSGK